MIEGITEFLPISSTAHLILFGGLLEVNEDFDVLFPVVCQLGAILAVVVIYWHRFKVMLPWNPDFWKSASLPFSIPVPGSDVSSARQENELGGELNVLPQGGFNALVFLCIATLPALVIGFFLDDLFETIFKSPTSIAAALGLGGVVIILFEKYLIKRNSQEGCVSKDDGRQYFERDGFVSGREASSGDCKVGVVLSAGIWFKLGIFQTLAILPGVSRSGATIIGGMLIGLTRAQVTLASFFMAVPVLCAASFYKLLKNYHLLSSQMIIDLSLGVFLSFIVAMVAIRWLLNYIIRKDSFAIFGWYRIALSAIIIWAHLK